MTTTSRIFGLRCAAVCLLALSACGDSAESPGARDAAAGDGDGDGDGDTDQDNDLEESVADAGMDEAPDSSIEDEVFPEPEPTCEDGKVRCRGACFAQVGEQKHGCELMWLAPEGEELSFVRNVGAEGALFMVGNSSVPLTRVETADFDQKVLVDGPPVNVRYADGGYVYYRDEVGTIMRVEAAGGAPEVVYELGESDLRFLFVHDDFAYFRSSVYVSSPLSRAKVGGGPIEPFTSYDVEPAIVPGEDRLFFVAHGASLGELRSVSWSDPDDYQVLHANYDIASLYLFESDPEHVYWDHEVGVSRVSRTGGEVSLVHDLDCFDFVSWVDATQDQLMYHCATRSSDPVQKNRIEALGLEGKRVVVDHDSKQGDVAEDESYFYLARGHAVFRIAKSEL